MREDDRIFAYSKILSSLYSEDFREYATSWSVNSDLLYNSEFLNLMKSSSKEVCFSDIAANFS